MSEEPGSTWQTIKTTFWFWLAGLANRHIGVMALYWANPLEWEDYMDEGVPMTAEVWNQ